MNFKMFNYSVVFSAEEISALFNSSDWDIREPNFLDAIKNHYSLKLKGESVVAVTGDFTTEVPTMEVFYNIKDEMLLTELCTGIRTVVINEQGIFAYGVSKEHPARPQPYSGVWIERIDHRVGVSSNFITLDKTTDELKHYPNIIPVLDYYNGNTIHPDFPKSYIALSVGDDSLIYQHALLGIALKQLDRYSFTVPTRFIKGKSHHAQLATSGDRIPIIQLVAYHEVA